MTGRQISVVRFFTLRVVKQEMSPYTPGEDRNADDNTKSVELEYREKQH